MAGTASDLKGLSSPLVSILISVYNAGDYLRPSLLSILDQSYKNLEIIIIDDGSTDGCMQSIQDVSDHRIRLLTQKNSGKSVALNSALDILTGEFYAVHDADDISYPARIERQVSAMQNCRDLAAVFTGYDIRLKDRAYAPRFAAKSVEECRADINRMRMPSHDPTVMYRVSMVKGFRYEPALRMGQGLDYILQVGEQHPMQVIGECLYSYRIHSTSTTRQSAESRRAKVRMVRERAAQRRGISAPAERGFRKGVDDSEKEYGIITQFLESVLDYRRIGATGKAMQIAASCARLHPWNHAFYKPMLYALAPLSVISAYRTAKLAA